MDYATPEGKSKRVQLLMRPSIYLELQKTARQRHISVNEIMNILAEKYVAYLHASERG